MDLQVEHPWFWSVDIADSSLFVPTSVLVLYHNTKRKANVSQVLGVEWNLKQLIVGRSFSEIVRLGHESNGMEQVNLFSGSFKLSGRHNYNVPLIMLQMCASITRYECVGVTADWGKVKV